MATLLELIGIRPHRSIGGITAQCVVEEKHTDELSITDHPVEQGAQVTDHAFKRPEQVTLTFGWSESISLDPLSFPTATRGSLPDLYQALLDLQASRVPFDIVTGKRVHESMLLQSLSETTNEKTEHLLLVTAVCRQVILVPTRTFALAPKARQSLPKRSTQVVQSGTKQATPFTPSGGGS